MYLWNEINCGTFFSETQWAKNLGQRCQNGLNYHHGQSSQILKILLNGWKSLLNSSILATRVPRETRTALRMFHVEHHYCYCLNLYLDWAVWLWSGRILVQIAWRNWDVAKLKYLFNADNWMWRMGCPVTENREWVARVNCYILVAPSLLRLCRVRMNVTRETLQGEVVCGRNSYVCMARRLLIETRIFGCLTWRLF